MFHHCSTLSEFATLAERYLEEGVIMDDHPNIHFVDGALGRRPAVLASGLDVWEIVEVAKDNGGSVADTASYEQGAQARFGRPAHDDARSV